MAGWQQHLQPLVRQVAKRYVCCRSTSFSTFNQAKASLVSGDVLSLQSLRNSLYPTISRPLFQHIQKLEFTSSKSLLGAETQKAASKSSKGTKQRRSSGISVNNNRKKTRFVKQRRGRMKGISHQGNHISFGNYALQALEPAWITSRQIEAGRRAMTRNACRGVKVWVRLFPDKSVTARPTETRMGRGKGAPQYSVAVVQSGRILYEMGGVTKNIAKKAIEIAASKMPIQTRFIVSG